MLVEDSQSSSAWHFDMSSYRNHLVTCSQASPLLRMICNLHSFARITCFNWRFPWDLLCYCNSFLLLKFTENVVFQCRIISLHLCVCTTKMLQIVWVNFCAWGEDARFTGRGQKVMWDCVTKNSQKGRKVLKKVQLSVLKLKCRHTSY